MYMHITIYVICDITICDNMMDATEEGSSRNILGNV